ncbi:hypothetical protein TPHA_0B03300 [Tetrapisispora phaffii CBS 4417]|uniref:Probable metalloprotease ARX1 n=1 Tax=Tetrapisispora phaffii (strain ATCC 24235 / CBS 4417 / NBRC 1672 / NRRL Y-8282 / UCD 70-5) TaxID=1071381 RepID=G8BPS1_TETPH|nr:hypothetical protein TPHA_0B03300 [Tetrapisispora phaffii CBS 4417]CCE62002.1 hypothetical protein TPHA_0B03300 [Tetrapisispora phaffii CBS 4417]
MALAISHEDTQILLKDKNVIQESVLDKYRTAGQVVQTALKYITGLINDSYHYKKSKVLSISELCLLTDSFILNCLSQFYTNKVNEKGIAFPTSIDVNQISNGWSPEIEDSENLKHWNRNLKDTELQSTVTGLLNEGDVVKITLGVHIDGYTSQVSHTMIIYPVDETNTKPTGPLLGGKADAVAAAHIAVETVNSLLNCALTPEKLPPTLGSSAQSINGQLLRSVVDTIARSYNCCVVPGSRIRRVRRFLAGQNEGIVAERDFKGVVWAESHQEAELVSQSDSVKDLSIIERGHSELTNASAIPTDQFVVQAGEAYLVDIKMASLEKCPKRGLVTLETIDKFTGKTDNVNSLIARPTIFVRDYAHTHILKLKTSKQLLSKIDKQGVYPLKLSNLSKLALSKDITPDELNELKRELRSSRLGMNEIVNNFLCIEAPIQAAKWVPWDHILKVTNPNGNLSYDATASLTLPGHELPLPKLGVSALKLRQLMTSSKEALSIPVARESNTILLCTDDVSSGEGPELLKLTGGSKTCPPSWVHSKYELDPQDSIVQGIFQLASLSKDKRFGLSSRETQPMKNLHNNTKSASDSMQM